MENVLAAIEKLGIGNLLAVCSFAVGIILSALALAKDKNEYFRLAGTFLLITLTLFARNNTVYAISILIVATLITRLDFLENLAAIFRGAAKEVISARSQSQKEKAHKVQNELFEEQTAGFIRSEKEATISLLRNDDRVKEYLRIEDAALNYLTQFYGALKRNVKISIRKNSFTFDAIKDLKALGDLLFEIKYTSNLEYIKHSVLPKLKLVTNSYTAATGRDAIMHLIIISDKLSREKEDTKKQLSEFSHGMRSRLILLSRNDIGIKE